MARADRRQAERRARQVQRRPRAAGGGAGIAEDTMFFPKLRAHARWMFVFLAVVFAGGFVFLGVGSGSAGLGDVLQGNWSDIFGSGSSSSAQIKKDEKRIEKNPKDYAAYKELATAQAADGKLDDAIATLQKLKAVNPKDADGLSLLASIYLRKADLARDAAAVAQAQAQTVGQAVFAYKDVVKLNPKDPGVQLQLARTAEQAQDTKTAVAAYKRFLKLAPEDPLAAPVRQRVKQLQQQPTVSTG